jgi:hypothetical protein
MIAASYLVLLPHALYSRRQFQKNNTHDLDEHAVYLMLRTGVSV